LYFFFLFNVFYYIITKGDIYILSNKEKTKAGLVRKENTTTAFSA